MYKISITLFYLLLITISSVFIACNDENEDPEPDLSRSVEGSMISDSEKNWTHFRFSKDFYSGVSGSSFEKGIDILSGSISQEQPILLTSHRFERGGLIEKPQLRLTIPSSEEMISTDLPFVIFDKEDRGEGIPENLKDITDLGFSGDEKFFLSGSESYGWFQGEREIFNAWRPTSFNSIRDSKNSSFGWLDAASISKLPIELFSARTETTEVFFNWVGELGITDIEDNRTMVYHAEFTSFPTLSNEGEKRIAIIGKKWSFVSDSIDFVSVLPDNEDLIIRGNDEQFAVRGITKAIKNTVFTAIRNQKSSKLHLILGNFSSGFQFVTEIENVKFISKVYKSDDSFFCVYQNQDNSYQIIKVTTDGAVTEYPVINRIGSLSHYNGNPAMAISDNDNGGKLTVYELSGNGLSPLGMPAFTKESTDGFLISDGSNLYAAVRNCISPKYKGAINQWCGWEVIKYNP